MLTKHGILFSHTLFFFPNITEPIQTNPNNKYPPS